MLGRGTRLCPAIHKDGFTLFDAVGVLEYFAKASEFTMEPPAKATRPIREVVEAIYGNEDRDSNVRVLAKRMQRIAQGISAEGREMMKAFVPDGDIAAFARGVGARLDRDWAGTMGILRDPSFLALLEKYPRAHSKFIVALKHKIPSRRRRPFVRPTGGRTSRATTSQRSASLCATRGARPRWRPSASCSNGRAIEHRALKTACQAGGGQSVYRGHLRRPTARPCRHHLHRSPR
jgi:hypothetical protein